MRSLRKVLPLLIALVLIVGLIASAKVSVADIVAVMARFSIGACLAVFGLTLLNLFLSSIKWRLVMNRIVAHQPAGISLPASLYYTCLGAALSLVFLPQAAMVVSRMVGSRQHLDQPTAATAAATIYEQIFDAATLVAIAVATLVAIVFGAGPGPWMVLMALTWAAAGFALLLFFRIGFRVSGTLHSSRGFRCLPASLRARLEPKLAWFGEPAAQTLLVSRFVVGLYAISAVRYALLVLRSYIVLRVVALPVGSFDVFKAYSLVQVAGLAAITPGNLGISDWTWAGVLVWMHYPLDSVVQFVVANRLAAILSIIACLSTSRLALLVAPSVLSSSRSYQR